MKENIDLTQNRDFRIKATDFFKTVTTDRIKPLSKKEFLNTSFPEDIDTGYIIQGNASERASKDITKEFCMGNYCDCCGAKLRVYYNDTLCEKCKAVVYK